jgi:hypothetical protein
MRRASAPGTTLLTGAATEPIHILRERDGDELQGFGHRRVYAEFVYPLEDVLDVHTRPSDASRPVVCMDEINRQVLADLRDPLPMQPGQPEREDYEYERRGCVRSKGRREDMFDLYPFASLLKAAKGRRWRRKCDWRLAA